MNFFSDDESETEDETDTVSGVRAPSASDRNDAPGLDGRPALDSSEGDVRPFSSVGAAGGVCRQDLAAHASDSESSDAGTSQCAGSKKVILTGKTPLLSAPAADNRVDLDSGDVLSEFHESPRPVHALQGLLKGSDGVRDLQPEGLRPRQQVQRSMNVFARLDAQSHTKESSHLTPLNSARSIGEVSASGTGCSRSRSDLWVAGSSPARSLREVPESCSANSMTAGFGNDVSSDSADNVLRDALQHHGLSLYEHASPPDDGKIRTNPSEVDPSLRRLSLSSRDSPRLPRSVGGSGLQLMERARNTQRSVGEVTAETSYSRSDVRYASGSLDPSHGDAPASVSPSATRLDAASSTSEGRMLSADEVLQEALGFTHWHDGSATVIQDANNVRTLRPFPSEVSFAAQDEMHFHSEGKVGAHLEAHDDEASSEGWVPQIIAANFSSRATAGHPWSSQGGGQSLQPWRSAGQQVTVESAPARHRQSFSSRASAERPWSSQGGGQSLQPWRSAGQQVEDESAPARHCHGREAPSPPRTGEPSADVTTPRSGAGPLPPPVALAQPNACLASTSSGSLTSRAVGPACVHQPLVPTYARHCPSHADRVRPSDGARTLCGGPSPLGATPIRVDQQLCGLQDTPVSVLDAAASVDWASEAGSPAHDFAAGVRRASAQRAPVLAGASVDRRAVNVVSADRAAAASARGIACIIDEISQIRQQLDDLYGMPHGPVEPQREATTATELLNLAAQMAAQWTPAQLHACQAGGMPTEVPLGGVQGPWYQGARDAGLVGRQPSQPTVEERTEQQLFDLKNMMDERMHDLGAELTECKQQLLAQRMHSALLAQQLRTAETNMARRRVEPPPELNITMVERSAPMPRPWEGYDMPSIADCESGWRPPFGKPHPWAVPDPWVPTGGSIPTPPVAREAWRSDKGVGDHGAVQPSSCGTTAHVAQQCGASRQKVSHPLHPAISHQAGAFADNFPASRAPSHPSSAGLRRRHSDPAVVREVSRRGWGTSAEGQLHEPLPSHRDARRLDVPLAMFSKGSMPVGGGCGREQHMTHVDLQPLAPSRTRPHSKRIDVEVGRVDKKLAALEHKFQTLLGSTS